MYKKYSNDFVQCVYCCKLVNLYYARTHLKSKSCKCLQDLLKKSDFDLLFLKYQKEINQLKSELRITA